MRRGFVQDLFWLVFNQQYVALALALLVVKLISLFDAGLASLGLPMVSDLRLIESWPIFMQVLVAFTLKDFIEWFVHRLMHLVPWMWEFHKLHHSIEELDWLGAFRTHWGELIIHRLFGFLPLVILGVDELALLIVAVLTVLIQEISHSNLNLDWGPLRYVFNSPRFHAWHHDVVMRGKGGQNFAVNLSLWDWLFGTSYWPENVEQPDKLGFYGMKKYPRRIWGRLLYPFLKLRK